MKFINLFIRPFYKITLINIQKWKSMNAENFTHSRNYFKHPNLVNFRKQYPTGTAITLKINDNISKSKIQLVLFEPCAKL